MKDISFHKSVIVTLAFPLIFTACFGANDNIKYHFDEEQLDFIAYDEGQSLSLIDTIGVRYVLNQNEYKRDFRKVIGYWGVEGHYEYYQVDFSPSDNHKPRLTVELYTEDSHLWIEFWGYTVYAPVKHNTGNDPQFKDIYQSINIDGKIYEDVYKLIAYKDDHMNESATLFWNKEHGVIQLLLSNGKTVTRDE
ncbi:hypothetical protein D770_25705 [Flammeovirgaceae bacterium 311]|nr:hypothetical protein D770_25705 [Flammeovirgaceae bacterium 311]